MFQGPSHRRGYKDRVKPIRLSSILRAFSWRDKYNNSVGFNHGTISNYFIIKSNTYHRVVDLPGTLSSRDSRQGISDSTEDEIQTARALYESKHWVQSKLIFDKVLRNPDSALPTKERNRVRYNLAHAHFALAEFSDAASHFQELVTIHDNTNEEYESAISDNRFWLGRCFYHLAKYEKASEQFHVFLRTYEKRPTGEAGATKATDGRLWLGLTFNRLGEYEDATEQLQTAFDIQNELAPDDLATLACRHHLANFLYKRKEYLEAHQHFDGLFHAEMRLNGPEKTQSVMSRCMMAFCLAKLRRYEEAQPHLERVSEHMKLQPCGTSDQLRDRGLVHYWLGRIAVEQMVKHNNNFFLQKAAWFLQGARQDISTAMAQDKTNDWLVEDMEDCKYYQARVMVVRGDFADAEQTFRQIIDDASDATGERQVGSRFELASSLFKRGKFEEAKSTLEEVVSPETPIEHCQHTGRDLAACLAVLGETYLELQNPGKGRDCLQHVVDAEPELPSIAYTAAQHALALSMFESRDFVGACKYSEAAYITRRTHFPLHQDMSRSLLSWALCEASCFEEAEQHLHNTLTAFPETRQRTPRSDLIHGNSHYYMGRILSHRDPQDWRGAVKHFEAALPPLRALDRIGNRLSQYQQCQYYMAVSLFHLRDRTTEARQVFEKLLRDDPKSESAAVTSSRLRSIPYWLGRIFLFQNKLKEAEAWLSKCLDTLSSETTLPLHPDISTEKVRYHYALCLFLLDTRGVDRRMTDSVEAVRQTLNRVPKSGSKDDEELYQNSRWLLGRGLHMKGEFGEACDYLRSSLTFLEERDGYDNESTSFTRAILADCLCELQLDSEANPLLTVAANHPDTNAYADAVLIKAIGQYWLGRLAYRAYQAGSLKGSKTVEEYFTAALSLLAAYRGNRARWNRIRLDSRHFLARIKLRRGQRGEAASMFRELAKQAHESDELSHAVDNEYYLGFTLSQQSKYREALPIFQKILDGNHPGRVVENARSWCQFQLGDCLYHTEKFKDAKDKFELAAESPDTVLRRKARFRLGQTIYRVGGHEEAEDIFQSIVDKPDQSTPQFLDDVRCWLGKTPSKLEKSEVSPVTSQVAIDSTSNE
ncbi:hypothetical protein F5883DRAFT_618976 [Diaporthe sp. PMI_573]|nr:hypothetical protein F5883DRAFT_618976 [Diaporthaceae sp. PMI_573]